MSSIVDPLFSPFSVRSLNLPNRTVMAPMGRMFAQDHIPHPDAAAYYRRRAEGGVGLLITEATGIDHRLIPDHGGTPIMHGEPALKAWQKVVDEVHRVGGKIIPQLIHQGMLRGGGMGDGTMESLRPSGILGEPGPNSFSPQFIEQAIKPTKPMSESDIQDVIDGFTRSALNAQALGFDGVELHGAHGYVIDSFLWSASNKRTDKWGGDASQRSLFATEIVRSVRKAVGEDFPIFFRFSQHKSHNYEAKLAQSPEELEQLLCPIAEAGVDVLDASIRRFYQAAFDGSDMNLAGWAKKLTGKPTIAVGSIGLGFTASDTFMGKGGDVDDNIPLLMERFNRNEFDLVSIGRSLISDPNYVNKLRSGKKPETFTREALETLI